MATHLDAINSARAKFNASPLNALDIQSLINAGARQGLEAASTAWNDLTSRCKYLTFNERVVSVTTGVGIELLPQTSDDEDNYDPECVKDILATRTGSSEKYPLSVIKSKDAEYRKPFYQVPDKPKYFWIEKDGIHLLPTPDIAYDLTVISQGLPKLINTENVTQETSLPADFHTAYIHMIYAEIRSNKRDPRAEQIKKDASNLIGVAEANNKDLLKRRGRRRLQFQSRGRRRMI